MGLLSLGKPLSWDETKNYAEYVRQHGIKQFINLYKKLKNRNDTTLKWGDEIEYMIVKFDHKNKKVRLSLKAKPILDIMDRREDEEGDSRAVLWRPEWGAWMIEATPGKPYGIAEFGSGAGSLSHFNQVEANMRSRRLEMQDLLDDDESLICITSYPRLGTEDFTHPYTKPDPQNSATKSHFLSDEVTYPGHPRFITIAQNIRLRRGRKVIINVPIFRDTKTKDPFVEVFNDEESDSASKADHVYLDAMGFGMGCCCLQVTFQASNINEARVLYDQLTPVCPIAMALSAASPIHRGYLTDRDCRWGIISASVDDRTKEELGEQPLKDNEAFRINKSRYDSIDSYLCESSDKYNDILLTYNKQYYKQMIEEGVDPILAKHIAHLFIRDPLVVYREKLEQNDEKETDHFENIQSTNWQTMRFKPPPPESSIGWRVEFRPMEVQMTEFENAAYVVFIVLLTRVILSFKLNLLLPISKVDENMIEAQKRDAVKRCKFWFRKDIISLTSPPEAAKCVEATGCSSDNCTAKSETPIDESCVLMSVNEIINGKGTQFPGLVPLLKHYLSSIELDVDTQCTIQQYLNLIGDRASGRLKTTAQWIRDFVGQHKHYKQDSVVNETINYDLLVNFDRIQKGELSIKELVGDNPRTKTNL